MCCWRSTFRLLYVQSTDLQFCGRGQGAVGTSCTKETKFPSLLGACGKSVNITLIVGIDKTHIVTHNTYLSSFSEMIPSLTSICQSKIMELLEQSEFHGRLVNDLCRYVPDLLLEPIFRVLLEKGVVTDTALLAYLVPNRLSLKINQARSIRNSTFRQIGLNCPHLVSYLVIFACLSLVSYINT